MIWHSVQRFLDDNSWSTGTWYWSNWSTQASGTVEVDVCEICCRSHADSRRLWTCACERAQGLARGDLALARGFFHELLARLALYTERRPDVVRVRAAWRPRQILAARCRPGRLGLRPHRRRLRREARPRKRRGLA